MITNIEKQDFRSMSNPLINLRDTIPVHFPVLNSAHPEFRSQVLELFTNILTLAQLVKSLRTYKIHLESYGTKFIEQMYQQSEVEKLTEFRAGLHTMWEQFGEIAAQNSFAQGTENEAIMAMMQVRSTAHRLEENALRKIGFLRRSR